MSISQLVEDTGTSSSTTTPWWSNTNKQAIN